jgi:hypothetical protein
MYAEARKAAAGGGAGPREVLDLLVAGEARIANSFSESLAPLAEGGAEGGVEAGESDREL